eukprot:TRINITY_DN8499_c2_g1_i1.p1 TRINITY_DN8499_c2_g1~~TRINITY_DN8499_c2_g1_i1.p1  ORF type:complete len:229 (+),score=30.37 TRINITY_DN8499_c2_g1_i1:105-791(+)
MALSMARRLSMTRRRCVYMAAPPPCLLNLRRNAGNVNEALAPDVPGGTSKLSDLAKVPLLKQETPVRVREIWLEQYRNSLTTVAGVLSEQQYSELHKNSEACPMFIVPVPRGEGYLNLVWQVQGQNFLYKTLDGFQSNSPLLDLSVTLFTELQASHQLVLLHSKIATNLLTKDEAARIIRYTREAYSDPEFFAWVKRFTHSPREFDYEEFMKEFRPLERWAAMGEASN